MQVEEEEGKRLLEIPKHLNVGRKEEEEEALPDSVVKTNNKTGFYEALLPPFYLPLCVCFCIGWLEVHRDGGLSKVLTKKYILVDRISGS